MKRTVQVNIFKIAFIILKHLIRLTKNLESGIWKQTRAPFVWLLKQSHTLFQPSNQYSELLREIPKYFSLVGLPGSGGERFFIAAIRPSSLVCNIFIASLASESWIMLQIRLHAIIWSYGLAQAGEEDLSPFTVSKRNAAVIKTWRSSLILTSCRSFMKLRELCESFVC